MEPLLEAAVPPDADLPAVVRPGRAARSDGEPGGGGEPSGTGAREPAAETPRGPGALRLGGLGLAVLLGVVTALGVAALLGEGFREAVLIEVETSPVGAEPTYSDAPREAARFFADRDTVSVVVPRDMTVADFLALYHLENNRAAADALRDQLGAAAPGDLLREGDRVTLPLTLRREEPGAAPEGS